MQSLIREIGGVNVDQSKAEEWSREFLASTAAPSRLLMDDWTKEFLAQQQNASLPLSANNSQTVALYDRAWQNTGLSHTT